jgi:hypothetical protein
MSAMEQVMKKLSLGRFRGRPSDSFSIAYWGWIPPSLTKPTKPLKLSW